MILRTGFVFAMLVVISACEKPHTDLTDEEKEAIVVEVTRTLNDYYVAIREKGLTAEFNYLDSSENFFWVPPGSSIPLSYDSVYKALNESAPHYTFIDNWWDTLRVQPLTHDYATYTGKLTSTITEAGGTVTKINLIETGLMVKRKSGWKLQSGQTSIVER